MPHCVTGPCLPQNCQALSHVGFACKQWGHPALRLYQATAGYTLHIHIDVQITLNNFNYLLVLLKLLSPRFLGGSFQQGSSMVEPDFWLFGYGYLLNHPLITIERLTHPYSSLIWKPPPHAGTINSLSSRTIAYGPADQRIPGYIKGYVRRFWQVGHPLKLSTPSSDGCV